MNKAAAAAFLLPGHRVAWVVYGGLYVKRLRGLGNRAGTKAFYCRGFIWPFVGAENFGSFIEV